MYIYFYYDIFEINWLIQFQWHQKKHHPWPRYRWKNQFLFRCCQYEIAFIILFFNKDRNAYLCVYYLWYTALHSIQTHDNIFVFFSGCCTQFAQRIFCFSIYIQNYVYMHKRNFLFVRVVCALFYKTIFFFLYFIK